MRCVYEGSIGMTWMEKHRDEVCMQGFCSDGMCGGTGA